jgi:hypothetical protein
LPPTPPPRPMEPCLFSDGSGIPSGVQFDNHPTQSVIGM